MTNPKGLYTDKLKRIIDRGVNDKETVFVSWELNDIDLDCSYGPMESGTLLTTEQQDQIRRLITDQEWQEQDQIRRLITDQEWQEAKDHTENNTKRSCFNCSKPLVYKEYIYANEKITITQLKEYWESNTIAILCCSCKRVMEMLKLYKKNNPKLFELL